jgi:hypothetical protein
LLQFWQFCGAPAFLADDLAPLSTTVEAPREFEEPLKTAIASALVDSR